MILFGGRGYVHSDDTAALHSSWK